MKKSDVMIMAEVAALLRVKPKTVYGYVKKGYIPYFKIGGCYRFSREEILKVLRGKAAKRPIRKGKKMATFSEAMNAVKQGKKIQRSLWNGVGLTVQMLGDPTPMTLRYLYIEYPQGHPTKPGMKVPWVASQEDMMTDDWIIIELPR